MKNKTTAKMALVALCLITPMLSMGEQETNEARNPVKAIPAGHISHRERKPPAQFDGHIQILDPRATAPNTRRGPQALPGQSEGQAEATSDAVDLGPADLIDLAVVAEHSKDSRAAYTVSGIRHAELSRPSPGATLTSVQRFEWTEGGNAQQYWLWVGSCRNCTDLFDQSTGLERSRLVSVPSDGRIVHASLFTEIGGEWYWEDYTFRAASGAQPATITSPTPGATLTANQSFSWSAGAGVSEYWLSVGRCKLCGDLYDRSAGQSRSATVPLPIDGRVLYVTVWSSIGGEWFDREYQYRAGIPAPPPPTPTATIRVTNWLGYPIEIFVNNTRIGTAAAASLDVSPTPGVFTRTYSPPPNSIQLSYVMTQPVIDGEKKGIPVNGSYSKIDGPRGTYSFTADNVFTSSTIFMPLITNRLGNDRFMEVNAGRSTRNDCDCKIANNATNFRGGYYYLSNNSNVRLWERGFIGIGAGYFFAGEDANGTVSSGGRLPARVDAKTGYFRWVAR
ncbi:MAG: hypothetical protein HY820_19570 [Acidobacteria bacterium]|nr:hypothetical protein [Acidobacteriota bacterium]